MGALLKGSKAAAGRVFLGSTVFFGFTILAAMRLLVALPAPTKDVYAQVLSSGTEPLVRVAYTRHRKWKYLHCPVRKNGMPPRNVALVKGYSCV